MRRIRPRLAKGYKVDQIVSQVTEFVGKHGLTKGTQEKRETMHKLVKERYGYDIFITDGRRTAEEQNALYQQGRTKPGQIVTYVDGHKTLSEHQSGISFDIAFRGSELYPKDHQLRENLAVVGREVGLSRGYDRRGWDKPHRSNLEDEPKTTFIEKVRRKMNIDFDFNVYQEAEEKYGIDKHVLVCIGASETSRGKNIKSKFNLNNIGNFDDGRTREFGSYEENVMELGNKLSSGQYLKGYTMLGELSCGGRIDGLGRSECGNNFYASSPRNRRNNMSKCLTDLTGEKKDRDRFEYKIK